MSLDINLICRNNESGIQRTLDCLSGQTYGDFRVLVIDDASGDATPEIVREHARKDKRFHYTRNRNRLYIGNFQRALWEGDADFVMPKSSDDWIAPTYIEKCLGVLKDDPDKVLCHSASSVVGEDGQDQLIYDPAYFLRILDDDPYSRSLTAAALYTYAPCFWGVYRRDALAKLAPIEYCNGFDHIVLCELALYGKMDYVDEILFRRSKGASPLAHNARLATKHCIRDLALDKITSDFSYVTPTITMIIGHLRMAAIARIPDNLRGVYINRLTALLCERFGAAILSETDLFTQYATLVKGGLQKMHKTDPLPMWAAREFTHFITGIALVLTHTAGAQDQLEAIRAIKQDFLQLS